MEEAGLGGGSFGDDVEEGHVTGLRFGGSFNLTWSLQQLPPLYLLSAYCVVDGIQLCFF